MEEQAKPWWESYKTHPAAELFPMIEGEELEKLAADIHLNQLHRPSQPKQHWDFHQQKDD